MSGFRAGERRWIERLDTLRNVIRQELITRQLTEHITPGMTVLDVGCGQGTQALRLAARGCRVTGFDGSKELLARFEQDAVTIGELVETIHGTFDDLGLHLGGRSFDAVCAHGVLMYLADRSAAISALAARVVPGGVLSLTFRNGHALAMRPGLRRDWAGALDAFDAGSYVNELGVRARADRLDEAEHDLAAVDYEIVQWFGVRVFNDAVPGDMDVPADEDLAMLLDAEDQAGRRDPYRWMASQLHVIARAPSH